MIRRQKIFKPKDIIDLTSQKVNVINIRAENLEPPPVEEEPYLGPSKEEVIAEIEQLRGQWEQDKAEAKLSLEEEQRISREQINLEIKKLEDGAAESAKQQLAAAEEKAQAIIDKGQTELADLLDGAEERVKKESDAAYQEGFQQGIREGREEGFKEIERLSKQLHKIISAVVNRRSEIIEAMEPELVDLTLLISRKVIKILSENQKNIVIYNTLEALKLMRSRGEVILHINPDDIETVIDYKQKFIDTVETIEGVHVVEDNRVDNGGCIVETDFGEIDARISSQMREIEDKILEMKPIKKHAPGRLVEDQ